MTYVKKRKIKVKKKNFTIFIITIILIVFGSYKCITILSKIITSPKKELEQKETKNNIKKKKEISKEDKKLQELENVNKKLDYFDNNKIDRYLDYKKNNKNLDITQIIKDVNMNLDVEPYEKIEKAKYLNTEKILVNKHYYLEKEYIPDNLETINNKYALSNMKLVNYAKDAFESMSKDASKEGLKIIAMSAYRSYDYQVNLYNRYVKTDGKEKVDTYSGRPGHSEHQTGLAVDVYNQEENYTNFEKTEEFDWMNEHAHEYGFIIRFPKDKEKETGYIYESWHYRYVGQKIAKYIKEHNISFEEYYVTKIEKS